MSIGDNIRSARKALRMSQDDLAEAIGANRVTISKYESGRFLPSVPALEKLALALRTTPGRLTGSDIQQNSDLYLSESLLQDTNLRDLIDQAKKVKPEYVRAATAMLKSLENDSVE